MTTGARIARDTGVVAATAPARAIAGAWPRAWTGLVACAGMAALLLSVAAHRVPWFPLDLIISRAIQSSDLRALTVPMRALNALGFAPLVDIAYGGIIAILFACGRRWDATGSAFAALGAAGVNHLAKYAVDRPRPSSRLIHVEHHLASSSYPAGHVLNLVAFAGFLCWLLLARVPASWGRTSLVVLLVTSMALMGIARIHSGEHWPSDVLGGYLLGTVWLAAAIRFHLHGVRRHSRVRGARAPAGLAAAILTTLVGLSSAASAAAVEPAPADSLGTSTGVPWNPPHAMARRLAWEEAVLLPGRLVSLPLSGLGYAADNLLLRLEQVPRFANGFTPALGPGDSKVVFRTARMGDRTGLGGAVEVRENLLHGALESRVAAEYAGTLHRYGRTLLTWSGHPMSLQYGYEWRPQDRYYGTGNASSTNSVSDYASQNEFVRGAVGWETNRERDPGHPRTALTLWSGPRSVVTRSGRESGTASYETRFPALGAATLNRRVENMVYGAGLLQDHRAGTPHWSRGWRTLLSAERFDAPVRTLALRSASGDGARFTRYKAEAEAGFSFMRDPRTVRLMVRMIDQQFGPNRDRMLPSDLSALGGQAGLSGYAPGRFQDTDLLLTRAEYVFPLERLLEVEVHSEWGAVYPDLWRDTRLGTLHNSFGFSLRARDEHAPRASAGLDFSRESIRLRFSVGGDQ